MNDMFDAIKGAAEGPGREMGKRLRGDGVAQASALAVRHGRRRRAALQGGAALVAAAVIATGAWLVPAWGNDRDSAPAGPTSWDGSMTDARIGDAETLPDFYPGHRGVRFTYGMSDADLDALFCSGPYDPPAAPGLTIRDESVRDLGISVSTNIVLADYSGSHGFYTPYTPGAPLTLSSDIRPSLHIGVTWQGSRVLGVTAYFALVSEGGIVRSLPTLSIHADGKPDEALHFTDYYDSSTGLTSVPEAFDMNPYSCPALGEDGLLEPRVPVALQDGYNFYASANGDYTLHVVVQVTDEDGVPLATFVDADELGVVPVHVEEDPAKWQALGDEYSSLIAALEARVEAEGVPIRDTDNGLGIRPASGSCAAIDDVWAALGSDLAVISDRALPFAFPVTVSKTELSGSLVLDANPAAALMGDGYWFLGGDGAYLALRRVTSDGVDHVVLDGSLQGTNEQSTGALSSISFSFDDPNGAADCPNEGLAALEPGTYEAAIVLQMTPLNSFEPHWVQGHGMVEETWISFGEVTITD